MNGAATTTSSSLPPGISATADEIQEMSIFDTTIVDQRGEISAVKRSYNFDQT